jgi:hypothetical protein
MMIRSRLMVAIGSIARRRAMDSGRRNIVGRTNHSALLRDFVLAC